MFNNYQSRPMRNNNNSYNSPPIDFSVNDIVFDKKTFEKAPIDWSKNDINFTEDKSQPVNLSVPPPAIAQSSAGQRQHKNSGGSTSITLQEVSKNLEKLLFLRQTMDDSSCYLDETGGFIGQPEAANYTDGSGCYQVEMSGGYVDPATGCYVEHSEASYIVDPNGYDVPLYCDTVYYAQPASTTSPPVIYSPNNPLYSEYTAAYSPNGSYVLHDGTCYSPNGSSYSMVQPGGEQSPGQVQFQDHAYSYAPGSKSFSRHNSVDSNASSMLSVASSPPRDDIWIKTNADQKPIGPVKKDKTGSEDGFDAVADLELNSLVDMIISD